MLRNIVMVGAILVCLGSHSYAAEGNLCPSYDLRGEALGPAVAQTGTGWCYGFAASDLLSNFFNQRVSQLQTSLQYVDSLTLLGKLGRQVFTGDPTAAGFTRSAVKKSLRSGLCFEKNARMPFSEYNLQYVHYYAVNGQMTEICKELEPVSEKIEVDTIGVASGSRGLAQLSRALNENFKRSRIAGIEYNVKLVVDELRGYHASSVVAQRENKGRCEVLIRNSWGEECDGLNYNKECERGHLWVSREELQKGIIHLVVLRKSSEKRIDSN